MSSFKPPNATKQEIETAAQSNQQKILNLIDCRTPDKIKYDKKIINAVTVYSNDLISDFNNLSEKEFAEKYDGYKLPEDGSTIIVHCNTGNGSGKLVTRIFEEDQELFKRFVFKHVEGGVRDYYGLG